MALHRPFLNMTKMYQEKTVYYGLFFIILGMSCTVVAKHFNPEARYELCFSPGNNCSSVVKKTINKAKKQVLVQAYNFTDRRIAATLINLSKNGIQVAVIVDKSQLSNQNSVIDLLLKQGIKVWVDAKPTIAHNKVMIIDGHTVIGGSYNYTYNATKNNAENVTIISDPSFASQFRDNWLLRQKQSLPLAPPGANQPI